MKKISRHFFIILICSLLITSCKSYRQETLSSDDFYSNKQIQQNVGHYEVYVHDGQNSYKMTATSMVGDTLKGLFLKAEQGSLTPRPKGKKEIKKHKDEINIYLKKPIDSKILNGTVLLTKADIDRSDVYVKNKKTLFAIFAGVALIVLLVAGLIYGLVVLAIKGSDESSNQSSNSSGCYVATMVYGSYDAPEVLVLRRFRDNFLAHSVFGRAFIKWYYANSPSFVERYKDSHKINSVIRFLLNGLVKLLS